MCRRADCSECAQVDNADTTADPRQALRPAHMQTALAPRQTPRETRRARGGACPGGHGALPKTECRASEQTARRQGAASRAPGPSAPSSGREAGPRGLVGEASLEKLRRGNLR
eukprot:6875299-Pyramimonas_sp.AAC.1